MNCPKCNKIIIDFNREGLLRIRSKLLLLKKRTICIMCPKCKNMIEVSIDEHEEMKKLALL